MPEARLKLLASRRPGSSIALGIVRAGTEHTFKVCVAEHRRDLVNAMHAVRE